MEPTYADYCWIVEQIRADVPVVSLRQDLLDELLRRHILYMDEANRLQLSDVGVCVWEKLAVGIFADELA